MTSDTEEEIQTTEEKETECLGSFFYSIDEIPMLVKLMIGFLCDEEDVFSYERNGYRTSVERDAYDEDCFIFTKEKIE